MNRLINLYKNCDGRFCEDVMILGLAVVVFSIMGLSIAQIA